LLYAARAKQGKEGGTNGSANFTPFAGQAAGCSCGASLASDIEGKVAAAGRSPQALPCLTSVPG
jgi:hypothetical protein